MTETTFHELILVPKTSISLENKGITNQKFLLQSMTSNRLIDKDSDVFLFVLTLVQMF